MIVDCRPKKMYEEIVWRQPTIFEAATQLNSSLAILCFIPGQSRAVHAACTGLPDQY